MPFAGHDPIPLPFFVKEENGTYTYTVPQASITGKQIGKIYIHEDRFVNSCGDGYMFYPTTDGTKITVDYNTESFTVEHT